MNNFLEALSLNKLYYKVREDNVIWVLTHVYSTRSVYNISVGDNDWSNDWAQWDDNIKIGFKEVIYVFSRLWAETVGGRRVQ